MARFPLKVVKAAMGPRSYDFLTIKNAWAEVTVEMEQDDNGCDVYHVDGKRQASLEAALEAAFAELASFERGRCD